MIDVGRDDGATARDFVPHELRRDEVRDRRAEALSIGKSLGSPRQSRLPAYVFTVRDVDHLVGHDAGSRKLQLRHRPTIHRSHRRVTDRENPRGAGARNMAIIFRPDLPAGIGLDTAAIQDPCRAITMKTARDVDAGHRIRVGTGRIINSERRFTRIGQRDFAQRHTDAGMLLRR